MGNPAAFHLQTVVKVKAMERERQRQRDRDRDRERERDSFPMSLQEQLWEPYFPAGTPEQTAS